MSIDHPMQQLFKIELPETTLYAYQCDGARVEVTVSHATEIEWHLTTRVITPQVDGCTTDVLWKYPKTSVIDVDWAFSWLISGINEGMTLLQMAQDLFLAQWGCLLLDELKPRIVGD